MVEREVLYPDDRVQRTLLLRSLRRVRETGYPFTPDTKAFLDMGLIQPSGSTSKIPYNHYSLTGRGEQTILSGGEIPED